ncbi:MAG: chemotaxis protein CheW [Hyphomicrobiaceae bacterium]|nr:chemotaxis protein CheW [Hyphomicrobiaceae bacterium]
MSKNHKRDAESGPLEEFVTVIIADQLFGLPINRVSDVFMLTDMTVVPLSIPEIAGVLNLRGRIVTAIDMRQRLGLPPRDSDETAMAVGIEMNRENFGLVIDRIGDVLHLPINDFDANPVNLDPRWKSVAQSIFMLESELLVILDVDRVLDLGDREAAA